MSFTRPLEIPLAGRLESGEDTLLLHPTVNVVEQSKP